MSRYEYKVIPAPKKGQRGKGVRGTEDKFANAIQTVMNELAEDGWEYQRTDTLPCEERSGLTGKTTAFQNLLVFRRIYVVTLAPLLVKEVRAPAAKIAPEPELIQRPEPVVEPAAPVAPPTSQSVFKAMRGDGPALGGVTKANSKA